ncbi:DinB family protein [Enemella sp. A6]|uniref:DinB family protein n=1 Tax=Enemella sp. A6 TaxID=3440152 RepID=UPI003EC050BC
MELTEPPLHGDEWDTLTGFLDYFRAVIERKSAGFTAEELARPLAPSEMTLGGMLKHLAYVEDFWFARVWAGAPSAVPWNKVDWQADPDWDWHSAADDAPDELRGLWLAAVQRSREIADADRDLTAATVGPAKAPGRFSRRWVLVHLIEEYARHAGHADFLAEALDGRTGD